MNALENSDSNKIFIPKTRVKPKINMEFMMEEGDHHYPGQYPNILQESGLSPFKPKEIGENYQDIFKYKTKRDKRVKIQSHTEEMRHNLKKLAEFVDINVESIMGEVSQPSEPQNVLLTGISNLANIALNKGMVETLETESKQSKYDELFDFYIFQYMRNLRLNQVNPKFEEDIYSSDEDVN